MKILILSKIDETAIKKLKECHDVVCNFKADTKILIDEIRDKDVIIFRSGIQISADILAQAKRLKLVIRAGAGLDNIDLEYIRKMGIRLITIPTPGARAVAEMTFALMLGLSRKLLEADSSMRSGRWLKHQLSGYLLRDKILGIVGAGNIGSLVGQLGLAWGMKVIGCVEIPSPEEDRRLKNIGIRMTPFEEVISISDYICVHVPLNDSTRNLININVLLKMKPGAFLVNIARGGVVNERDLYTVLTENNILRGAGLDVHEAEGDGKLSPLASLANVILTPHIGAMTVDSQGEIGQLILEIISVYQSDPSIKSIPDACKIIF